MYLAIRPLPGLAEVQEPGGTSCEAGGGGGLEMKRPKWLGDSRATKADKQKKARQQTDQRMKQQDAVKKQRDEKTRSGPHHTNKA
jgi:hypothetical protein